MASRRKPHDLAEIQALLRAAGLRSTASRVAVVRTLRGANKPLSHGELADQLAPQGLDRATVFRNLNDLVDAGLILRAELGDHVWRFEWRKPGHDNAEPHPHFVCVECGTVTCVRDFRLDGGLAWRGLRAGRVTEILFRGQCTTCAAGGG